MAGLTTLALSAATLAGGISQFAAQRQAATAARRQGSYEAELHRRNAEVAEIQAQDALARGDRDAGRHRRAVGGLVGSQRAALAAQGLDIDSGSALDIQAESVAMGELDALTIRNNARREAWGFRVQASNALGQANLAEMAGRNTAQALRTQSLGTLLTTGTQMYSIFRPR